MDNGSFVGDKCCPRVLPPGACRFNHLSKQNGRDAGFHETIDAEFATETLANSGLFRPIFASLQRRFCLTTSVEIPRNCASFGERASERA